MDAKQVKYFLEYLRLSGVEEIFYKPETHLKPEVDKSEDFKEENPGKILLELKEEYKNCQKCVLAENRIKFVYGEGNPQAKLMLIGEGPGADENATGRPFVGRAGRLLTKMLLAIKLKRDEVYITNVVKCRPPNNRNPLPNEVSACLPYLEEQISIIKPKLILLLGKVAAVSLLKMNKTLGQFRERTYSFQGIKTYVTYHPSALLRNPGWKKYAWIDLQKVQKDYLDILAREKNG